MNVYALVLSFFLLSCSTQNYKIETKNKTPFPARPVKTVSIFKVKGIVETEDIKGKKKDEIDRITKVEVLSGNKRLIQNSVGTDKFQVTVDCSSGKVIEKKGFEEALERLEKGAKTEEEKDASLSTLVSYVQQAPDYCKNVIGPFSLENLAGKSPGYTWLENIPIEGFESGRMKATFAGWHEMENISYAVLVGFAEVAIRKSSPYTNISK